MKTIIICKGEDSYDAYYKTIAWIIRNGIETADCFETLKSIRERDSEMCVSITHMYISDGKFRWDVGQMDILKTFANGTTVKFYPNLLFRDINPSVWKRLWLALRRTK